jgi:hypothetical protein
MRKLTKLRIDEVSSCDAGAGEGTRVVLMKRLDPVARHQRLKRLFGSIDFGKALPVDNPDDGYDDFYDDRARERGNDDKSPPKDPDEEDQLALHPKLEQAVAALIAANPSLTRQQAAHHLLHTHDGRALARHLSDITKGTTTMTRAEEMREMRDFAKQHGGMNSIAKHIVAKGTTTLTEHEFTSLLMESAKLNKMAGESDGSAFSRIFSAPENVELRKAHAISKSTPAPLMSIEPVQVAAAVDADDSATAYAELEKRAGELRTAKPELSAAQAFAKAFTENPALASRAHRRPTPDALNQFPR